MLPVCSATPGCSSHSQISFHGGLRPFTLFQKDFQVRCNAQDKSVWGISNGNHLHRMSFKPQATESFYSNFVESTEQLVPVDLINSYSCPDELDDVKCNVSNVWSSSVEAINESTPLGVGELKYVETSSISAAEEKVVDLTNQPVENANNSMGMVGPETTSTVDAMPENPTEATSSLNFDNDSLTSVTTGLDDFLAGVNKSINLSLNKGENAVKSLLDKITSSITSVMTSASEAIDNAQALANNKVSNISSDLKEASSKANAFAVDLLRRTIVVVEDSLSNGASSFVYYYGSAKERLPPEIKDAMTFYEERTGKALKPVGSALQQVYAGIEGLERSLGFDPNDPIVPFSLLFGTSATLWAFYWIWAYGGYSGDLSPKLTLELLSRKENALLIDVRPEVLRERDGIPNLRRVARFRYASVSLPEVNSSMLGLLKSGRDLDDSLIATVIRNLKTIEDRSKVIIMDADGSRSKGIARSLRKLGVKRPYLVQGGFQSWVKQGLRIKELKPETTLAILNEEAEAILEDISPSPVQVLGYGVGSVAAIYALLEWEKSLQLIGILGLVQTIYRRVSSYENSEDLKKDIRLLLAPVRLGAQAFSWVAGKLETNGIGLPTSPSTLDVQNRVLRAAAKLESQPSDAEGIQDPSPEVMAQMNEKVDLSEA
ncbi:calcium sensing receptor, chloroplastic-like [Durio zibethinus]|uniref:Calcium sensing receptor, chloroplastic-like n=1 Tax=Durio zibethinus TaxID=66656 RepID=A0A6P5X1I4_DURZI|nr:calcium sensing receptor, chloroplastic-like [Durio zibethinus]XP_022722023.1 calcium sensing receptor, chloroplastic-like [Durio zibethinus]XP_022722024.1 calcium sensing receptor, chloroplastic-like [Durio zibethinus]